MKLKALMFIPLSALLVTGCTNEEMGTLFGAAAGAAIGTQIGHGGEGTYAAVAGFSLLGALIGSEVGKGMDQRDRYEAQRAQRYAMERGRSGYTQRWNNPDSGNYGTVTPAPAYQDQDGRYCRPYTQTITVDGQTRTLEGTACRQSDGTWVIVDTGY
ncbi:MAG: RT0821/Lpp0805 family surface protein [Alphaproteobacteria bacterium]